MNLAHSNKQELLFSLRQKLHEQNDSQANRTQVSRVPTGWDALDEATQGGLFKGALNEVQVSHDACGVLEALLPSLQNAPSAPGDPKRFWAWVHPQRMPYPPALSQMGFELDRWLVVRPRDYQEQLWALETIMRSGLCEGLVTFMHSTLAGRGGPMDQAWRRLQLAAREGRSTALLLGSKHLSSSSSPAALRLAASPLLGRGRRRQLLIEILKCRGQAFAEPVLLEWSHDALDEPALSRPQFGKFNTRPSRKQETALRALHA